MSAIIYPTWSTQTARPVTQVGHGFTVGQQLYWNGTAWALALADNQATLRMAAVAQVIDADRFLIAFEGVMEWPAHGLTNALYYLSSLTPGAISTDLPSGPGVYRQPVLRPLGPDHVRLLEIVIPEGGGSVAEYYTGSRDLVVPAFHQSVALVFSNTAGTDWFNRTQVSANVRFKLSYVTTTGDQTPPVLVDFDISWGFRETQLATNASLYWNKGITVRSAHLPVSEASVNGNSIYLDRLTLSNCSVFPDNLCLIWRNGPASGLQSFRWEAWVTNTGSVDGVQSSAVTSNGPSDPTVFWSAEDHLRQPGGLLLNDLIDVDVTGVS